MKEDYGPFDLQVGMKVRLRNGKFATVTHRYNNWPKIVDNDDPRTSQVVVLDGIKNIWAGGNCDRRVGEQYRGDGDVVEILNAENLKIEDFL